MSSKTRVRLTPGQRLGRGLKYSTVGPVDVGRGAVGLGVESVRSSASWVGDRYRRSKIAQELKADLASAQETIANLPAALDRTRKSRRRGRRLIFVGVGAAVLAGGAVTFSILRRSAQPEPSPLPPSVEVAPKP